MHDLPDAPYPAEIRAKGWRFELDMERARQSDTWTLCPPDVRPWLLMMWATAWEQTPCGSLPDDDALIAAKIGMTAKLFAKHRVLLMRNWVKCRDLRLYHHVLTQRVIEMMERRRKESDRKALARARKTEVVPDPSTSVPRDNQGTTEGLHPVSDTGTGTGTGTGEEDYGAKAPASSARADPTPAAAVCLALKAAGISAVSPGNLRLVTLLDAGATVPEFVAMVPKALEAAPARAFEYVLGAVEGERTRAKTTAGRLHQGRLPNKQQALEERNRAVGAEWLKTMGAA